MARLGAYWRGAKVMDYSTITKILYFISKIKGITFTNTSIPIFGLQLIFRKESTYFEIMLGYDTLIFLLRKNKL